MRLYEKFELAPQLFTKAEERWIKNSMQNELNTNIDLDMLPYSKGSLISKSDMLSFHYYLRGEKSKIEQYARSLLDYAMEYFFGDWRHQVPTDVGTHDAEWWKKVAPWVNQFRTSILWASVLGEWCRAKSLAEYPNDVSMLESLEGNEKKGLYTTLAIFLRERRLQNARRYIRIIETGRKKREKLLLNVLRAINKKDSQQFAKEFNKYLKYYKAYEFPKNLIPEKLAIDGTILFNLAGERGMEVEFPRQYIDHYIKLGANTPVSIP